MSWSWTQVDPATGKEVYIPDLLTAAAAGFDTEAQKPAIATLARIVNEELPVLALFERYSTDVINYDTRVSGWLPFTDPIYKNNQADLYIAKQFLDPLKGQSGILPFSNSQELLKVLMGVMCAFASSFRSVHQPFLDIKANLPLVHFQEGAQLVQGKNLVFVFHDIYY